MSATGPNTPADAVQAALAPIRPEGFFGGSRLLAADARVAYLLLDDARRRTMESVFGIPRDEKSGMATVIALAMLMSAMRSRAPHRPNKPTLSDSVFAFGAVRETAYDIAGPWSRESSYFGTLLAFALVGATARLAVRKSVHGVRGVSHQAYTEFHHRYGHLIRRNRRQRPAPRASDSLPLSDT